MKPNEINGFKYSERGKFYDKIVVPCPVCFKPMSFVFCNPDTWSLPTRLQFTCDKCLVKCDMNNVWSKIRKVIKGQGVKL